MAEYKNADQYFARNHYDASNDPDAPFPRAAARQTSAAPDPDELATFTEMRAAERFVDENQDRIRYCSAIGWLFYNGSHWEADDLGRVAAMAKETIRQAFIDAAGIIDSKERDKKLREIRSLEASNRITGILKLAESDQRIRVRADAFDADPWMLNCANKTLDLRTGKMRAHDPADLLTRCAGTDYQPAAICERWEEFIGEIFDFDPELVAFCQRMIGYTLTGATSEQCLFILHGSGANGKSVLLKTLQAVLGSYATTAAADSFMVKRGEAVRNDLARLAGARLVASIETDEGQRLAESLVKTLTGEDTIVARFLFKEHFEFRPQFKLWLAANHKPQTRGQDHALWRRIHLIPFTQTFAGDACDPGLAEKLAKEARGILAWSVRGLTAWREGGLRPPAAVKAATAAYREESDVLAEWIESRCILGPAQEAQTTTLYRDYSEFTTECGERPMGKKSFLSRLRDRGIGDRRTGRARWCTGIGLLNGDGGDGRAPFLGT